MNEKSKEYYRNIWNQLHSESIKPNTEDEMIQFKTKAYNILSNIKCGVCKDEALQYWSNNPIDDYFKLNKYGSYIGCFYYF